MWSGCTIIIWDESLKSDTHHFIVEEGGHVISGNVSAFNEVQQGCRSIFHLISTKETLKLCLDAYDRHMQSELKKHSDSDNGRAVMENERLKHPFGAIFYEHNNYQLRLSSAAATTPGTSQKSMHRFYSPLPSPHQIVTLLWFQLCKADHYFYKPHQLPLFVCPAIQEKLNNVAVYLLGSRVFQRQVNHHRKASLAVDYEILRLALLSIGCTPTNSYDNKDNNTQQQRPPHYLIWCFTKTSRLFGPLSSEKSLLDKQLQGRSELLKTIKIASARRQIIISIEWLWQSLLHGIPLEFDFFEILINEDISLNNNEVCTTHNNNVLWELRPNSLWEIRNKTKRRLGFSNVLLPSWLKGVWEKTVSVAKNKCAEETAQEEFYKYLLDTFNSPPEKQVSRPLVFGGILSLQTLTLVKLFFKEFSKAMKDICPENCMIRSSGKLLSLPWIVSTNLSSSVTNFVQLFSLVLRKQKDLYIASEIGAASLNFFHALLREAFRKLEKCSTEIEKKGLTPVTTKSAASNRWSSSLRTTKKVNTIYGIQISEKGRFILGLIPVPKTISIAKIDVQNNFMKGVDHHPANHFNLRSRSKKPDQSHHQNGVQIEPLCACVLGRLKQETTTVDNCFICKSQKCECITNSFNKLISSSDDQIPSTLLFVDDVDLTKTVLINFAQSIIDPAVTSEETFSQFDLMIKNQNITNLILQKCPSVQWIEDFSRRCISELGLCHDVSQASQQINFKEVFTQLTQMRNTQQQHAESHETRLLSQKDENIGGHLLLVELGSFWKMHVPEIYHIFHGKEGRQQTNQSRKDGTKKCTPTTEDACNDENVPGDVESAKMIQIINNNGGQFSWDSLKIKVAKFTLLDYVTQHHQQHSTINDAHDFIKTESQAASHPLQNRSLEITTNCFSQEDRTCDEVITRKRRRSSSQYDTLVNPFSDHLIHLIDQQSEIINTINRGEEMFGRLLEDPISLFPSLSPTINIHHLPSIVKTHSRLPCPHEKTLELN